MGTLKRPKTELKDITNKLPEKHLTIALIILAVIIFLVACFGKKHHKAILALYLAF